MSKLFYKPSGAFCADFITFYDEGKFRLFYLNEVVDLFLEMHIPIYRCGESCFFLEN